LQIGHGGPSFDSQTTTGHLVSERFLLVARQPQHGLPPRHRGKSEQCTSRVRARSLIATGADLILVATERGRAPRRMHAPRLALAPDAVARRLSLRARRRARSYADARYPTAAAHCRALEPTARRLDAREFASYALHRGLTHLALGGRARGRASGRSCQSERRPAIPRSSAMRIAVRWSPRGAPWATVPASRGFSATGTAPAEPAASR